MTYDDEDRLLSFFDHTKKEIVEADGSLSTPLIGTVHRTDIQYNSLQQMTDYKEHQTNSRTRQETDITFSNGRYDKEGRLSKFSEKRREEGVDDEGQEFLRNTETERLLTTFNAFGQVMETWDRSSSSEKPSLVISTHQEDRRYDENGQLTSYFIDEHQKSVGDVDHPYDLHIYTQRLSTTYNDRGHTTSRKDKTRRAGGTLNVSETTHVENIKTNQWGETMAYDQVVVSEKSPDQPIVTHYRVLETDDTGRGTHTWQSTKRGESEDILDRSDMHYDDFGQLFSYTDETQSTEKEGKQFNKWEGTYNASGQLESTEEFQWNDSNDLTQHNNRQDITYNSLGIQSSYQDTKQSSDKPDLVINTFWESLGSDRAGQLTGYQEINKSRGPGFELDEKNSRTDIGYDALGLINNYIDDYQSSAAPNITNRIIRQSTTYDGAGREDTFHQNEQVISLDGSLDTEIQKERTHSSYNNKNQLMGRKEKTRSSAAPNVVVHSSWEGEYDNQGNLSSTDEYQKHIGRTIEGYPYYKETHNSVKGRQWDNFGRLTDETKTFDNGLGLLHTLEWGAKGFDNLGRLQGELITNTTDGKSEDAPLHYVTTTERDDIAYNRFGQQESVHEVSRDSRSSNKQTEQWITNITYNENGQKEKESIDGKEIDLETGGEVLFTHNTSEKSYDYDDQGRIVGSHDKTAHHHLGTETETIQSNIRYNELGLEKAKETEVITRPLSGEPYEKRNHQKYEVLLFNKKGQAFHVREENTNNEAPDRIDVTESRLMKYDENGQLDSFDRWTQSAHQSDPSQLSLSSSERRLNTSYDQNGRVTKTKSNKYSDASPSVNETLIENFSYNDLGQQTNASQDQTRTTKDGRLNVNSSFSKDMSYDNAGRLSNQGTTSQSSQTPELTHREEKDLQYGENGLVIGEGTETQLTGRSPPMEEAEADAFLNTFPDLTDEQKEALRTILIDGLDIDQRFESIKSDITHNSLGQMMGYTENQTSSSTPGLLITRERTHTTYNSLGQETDTKENEIQQSLINNQPFLKTFDRSRSDITYDTRGRLNQFIDRSTEDGVLTKTHVRSKTTYNDLGLVEATSDLHLVDGIDPDTKEELHTQVQSNQFQRRYNDQGQLKHFVEEVDSSANGKSSRLWDAEGFDIFGNPFLTKEHGHSAQKGQWSNETAILAIDAEGRSLLTHITDKSNKNGNNNYYRTPLDLEGNMGINALGQMAFQMEWGFKKELGDFVSHTDARNPDAYNERGDLVHSSESIFQDEKETHTENSTDYNIFGQPIEKTTDVTEKFKDGPIRIHRENWKGSYDDQGHLESFGIDDAARVLSPEGELLHTEINNQNRNNIEYDENGLVSDYRDEKGRKAFNPEGETILENFSESVRNGIQYTNDGQMEKYHEEGQENGAEFSEDYIADAFDDQGNPTDFVRSGFHEQNGPTHITQEDGEFNDRGQPTDYSQYGVQGGQVFQKSLFDIKYNAQGQMKSAHEEGENDDGLYENDSEMTYDAMGLLQNRKETGTNKDGAYTSETDDFEYDRHGNLSTKKTTLVNAANQTHTKVWKAGEYDEKGRLQKSVEVNTIKDEAGKLVDTITNTYEAQSFFDNGLLHESKSTTVSEKANGEEETNTLNHTNLGYDSQGMITGTIDTTSKETVDAETGQVITEGATLERRNIKRYTAEDAKKDPEKRAGRIRGHEQTLIKHNGEEPVYSVVDNILYDDKGVQKGQDKADLSSQLLRFTLEQLKVFSDAIFQTLRNVVANILGGLKGVFAKIKEDPLTPMIGDIEIDIPGAALLLSPDDYNINLTNRKEGFKDNLGRPRKWKETSWSSTAQGKIITSDVDVTYQGATNLLDTYHAINTEETDETTKISEIDQHDFIYKNGRVEEVQGHIKETVKDKSGREADYHHENDYTDKNLAFDQHGRVMKSLRTTYNDSKAPNIVTTQAQSRTYDDKGRVANRETITKEEGTDLETGEVINKTSSLKEDLTYTNNNQVKKNLRTTSDSSAPGKILTDLVTTLERDHLGQAILVSHDQTTDQNGDIKKESFTDNIESFSLSGEADKLQRSHVIPGEGHEKRREEDINHKFDNLGRLVDTKKNINQKTFDINSNGEAILRNDESWTERNQNTKFNALGQAIQVIRDKEGDNLEPGVKKTHEVSNLSYDEHGRLKGNSDFIVQTLNSGRRRYLERENEYLAYNNLGQATDIDRTTLNDSLAPSKVGKEEIRNAQYDKDGNMTTQGVTIYESGINDDGTPYTKQPEKLDRHFEYDKYGNITSNGEFNHNLVEGIEKEIPVLQDEIIELRNNMLSITNEDEKKAAEALLTAKQKELNSLEARLDAYSEKHLTSLTDGMVYNDQNQLVGAVAHNLETGEITTQGDFQYNESGLRTGYTEKDSITNNSRVISQSYDDLNRVEINTSQNTDYVSNKAHKDGKPHTYTIINETQRRDANGRPQRVKSTTINDSAKPGEVNTQTHRNTWDDEGQLKSRDTRSNSKGSDFFFNFLA